MVDYTEKLRQDLLEQFKEKPVIDALICAVGEQLTDLHRFFTALRDERGVLTAIGKQLDGVGDIVCLSREEAGALACTAESVYVLDDEQYRDYLIFKIWKNTNNCTYHDVIKAFRMFWSKPLYYHEDPEEPAVMLLDTGVLMPEDHAEKLYHDGCRDIWHDTECKDRGLRESAAREHIKELHQAAAGSKIGQRVKIVGMYTRKHHVTSQSIYEYQQECHEETLAELFDCPNVFKGLNKSHYH